MEELDEEMEDSVHRPHVVSRLALHQFLVELTPGHIQRTSFSDINLLQLMQDFESRFNSIGIVYCKYGTNNDRRKNQTTTEANGN